MIGADHARQQKHGGQFHANHVRTEQRHPDFLGSDSDERPIRSAALQQIHDLGEQDAGQKHGANPDARCQPLLFRFDGFWPRLNIMPTNTKSTMMAPA